MKAIKYIIISCITLMVCSYTIIKQPYTFFTIDAMGNSYLVNGDEVTKYNTNGIALKKYSNKKIGSITSIDATNPLKLILYYKDFQQIVFLDNQLTQNGDAISLENKGFEQTDLVCSSNNNGFWIYSKQNAELIRFNEKMDLIVRTGNLKQLLDLDIKPNFMIEHNGYLYVNYPVEGVLVFDIYGTYYKTIPIKHLTRFQVDEKKLIYYANSAITIYDTQLLNESQKPLTDSLVKNVFLLNNKLYKQYTDSISIVTIE